jgi:phage terminase large subunit GpA-like protein
MGYSCVHYQIFCPHCGGKNTKIESFTGKFDSRYGTPETNIDYVCQNSKCNHRKHKRTGLRFWLFGF